MQNWAARTRPGRRPPLRRPGTDAVAVLTADRAPRRRARQPLAAMALMLMLVFVVAVALGVLTSN